MPTTLKLLNKLKDEELEKVYGEYLEIRLKRHPVPWNEYVRIVGRERAMSSLMLAVNTRHPADSNKLWLASTLILSIAILTSILR